METTIVAVAIIAAGLYLAYYFLRPLIYGKRDGRCATNCGCSSSANVGYAPGKKVAEKNVL